MKHKRLFGFSLIILAIILIFAFHTYDNLLDIMKPPSEQWGRDTLISTTDAVRTPTIKNDVNGISITYLDKNEFKRAKVNAKGQVTGIESLLVKNIDKERLLKYKAGKDAILWTENYNLYSAPADYKNKTGVEKRELLKGVYDFNVFEADNTQYLIAAKDKNISLYKLENELKLISTYEEILDNLDQISIALDKNGTLHIVYALATDAMQYDLGYISYEINNKKWVKRIEPVSIKNSYSLREGATYMNNIEIGFDEANAYIFYEIGTNLGTEMKAKTSIAVIPLDNNEVQKVNFNQLLLNESIKPEDQYIGSLKCVGTQAGKIEALAIIPAAISITDSGYELHSLLIGKGNVIDKKLASKTGNINSNIFAFKSGQDIYAGFIDIIGREDHRITLTGTGSEYKSHLSKVTSKEVKKAMVIASSYYSLSLLTSLIKFVYIFPILLWPLYVDFTQNRKFLGRPILTLNIGVLLTLIPKVYSFIMLYKNSFLLLVIPSIMKTKAFIAIIFLVTSLISYAITRLIRSDDVDMAYVADLLIYIVLDTLLVSLLYAPYMLNYW